MKRFIGLAFMLVAISLTLQAQDENSFTDEELTKYATVMKWAEVEKAALSSIVKDSVTVWLEGTELAPSQYNTLSKAKKAGTLEEAEATEEEVQLFTDIQARIDDKKAAFKETYTTKIKEDIGAGLYNRLRKALKADQELKARYEEVYAAVELDGGAEDDTEAGSEESAEG